MFENLASLCTKISKSWFVLLFAVYQEDSYNEGSVGTMSDDCPSKVRECL